MFPQRTVQDLLRTFRSPALGQGTCDQHHGARRLAFDLLRSGQLLQGLFIVGRQGVAHAAAPRVRVQLLGQIGQGLGTGLVLHLAATAGPFVQGHDQRGEYLGMRPQPRGQLVGRQRVHLDAELVKRRRIVPVAARIIKAPLLNDTR